MSVVSELPNVRCSAMVCNALHSPATAFVSSYAALGISPCEVWHFQQGLELDSDDAAVCSSQRVLDLYLHNDSKMGHLCGKCEDLCFLLAFSRVFLVKRHLVL